MKILSMPDEFETLGSQAVHTSRLCPLVQLCLTGVLYVIQRVELAIFTFALNVDRPVQTRVATTMRVHPV